LNIEAICAGRARAAPHGFYDECVKGEIGYLLGFIKPKVRVNRRAAVAVVGDQLSLQGVSTRFV
jgi:hypothetical protein